MTRTESAPAPIDTAFARMTTADETGPGRVTITRPGGVLVAEASWPTGRRAGAVVNGLGWYFTGKDNVARIGGDIILPVARY